MEPTPASISWFLGHVVFLPGTQCHMEISVTVHILILKDGT